MLEEVEVDGAAEILEAGYAAEDLRKSFVEPRPSEADDTFLFDRWSLSLCHQLFTKFIRRLSIYRFIDYIDDLKLC